MRLIKIGTACLNTTVGATTANTDQLIERALSLAGEGCTVVAFQEQVIAGYPAEDLVQWPQFVTAQWAALERFAAATRDAATVFAVGLTVEHLGHLYNSVAVVCRGRVRGVVPKEKLPTYGVFYERRTFTAGRLGLAGEVHGVPFGDLIFRFPFGTMAIEICEDLWSPRGPMARRCFSGAELVLNASASPFRSGVAETRHELVATRAADNQATVVYVNQVGGNDSLVFDGGVIINQNGRTVFEGPRWTPGAWTQVVDLDRTARGRRENTTWRTDAQAYLAEQGAVPTIDCPDGPTGRETALAYPAPARGAFFIPVSRPTEDPRDAYFRDLVEAKIMGLDYAVKTHQDGPICIALSGGKDSFLTAIVAWLYLKRRFAHLDDAARAEEIARRLLCYSMPTRYNSGATRGLSRDLCAELGATLVEVPIEEAFARETEALQAMAGGADVSGGTALQNVQARLRGARMWNVTNVNHGLWLQTGNMSEKATGYTTVGGDLMGAYGLIGNEPKSVVIEELRWIADNLGVRGAAAVLAVKASAELKDNQEDERDLMPFDVLDACIYLYAGEKLTPAELVEALAAAFPERDREALTAWTAKFLTLFHRSIFKWVQAPESVHLGSLELDRERALQLPVVHATEWEN